MAVFCILSEIKATVRGGLLDVHCEICGAVGTWVPGEEGFRELLKGR